jgi:hypothetical protein
MVRVQILLSEVELDLLDEVQRSTGTSRSESIRRAIRSTFGDVGPSDRIRLLEQSAGAWKDRSEDGRSYVDALRGDLDERLRRLGLT